MHILVSIDPGVSLGYAVWDAKKYRSIAVSDALLQHGCSTPRPKGQEQEKNRIKRIANLCGHLIDLHGHHNLSIVAENQFFHSKMDKRLVERIANCHQILGMLKVHFVDYPFDTVLPADWHGGLMCGMGKLMKPKEKSLYRCEQLLGRAFSNHNETDAILIGVYYLDHMKFAERIKEAI